MGFIFIVEAHPKFGEANVRLSEDNTKWKKSFFIFIVEREWLRRSQRGESWTQNTVSYPSTTLQRTPRVRHGVAEGYDFRTIMFQVQQGLICVTSQFFLFCQIFFHALFPVEVVAEVGEVVHLPFSTFVDEVYPSFFDIAWLFSGGVDTHFSHG